MNYVRLYDDTKLKECVIIVTPIDCTAYNGVTYITWQRIIVNDYGGIISYEGLQSTNFFI